MNEFTILSKVPLIRYSNNKVEHPTEISNLIERHWSELINSGKSFTRGDVFSVTKTENLKDGLEISINLSDYAHYLASIHGVLEEKNFCRVVHSSVMIETKDDWLVFGEMNSNTALPGRIQCIGGGITREDLHDDGATIDIEKNAATEMLEEVGLSAGNSDQVEKFSPWAVVESGPQKAVGVVFWAKLVMNLDQFLFHYTEFEKTLEAAGEKPELAKLVYIQKGMENKESWLEKTGNPFAEYLPILFKNL